MSKKIDFSIFKNFLPLLPKALQAFNYQIEIQTLISKEKFELRKLNVSDEKIVELIYLAHKEAICQVSISNSQYIINYLSNYRYEILFAETPEIKLEKNIQNLIEQLKNVSDDTIADNLIQEIKESKKQLQQLIINNNIL
ncbi:hypothetical protein AB670_02784 [Chryseobacterium sp. MOF25P]|uniref:hypothetical protein n=1 Tax=unclassified Chryseobacterium TaxID=2593645 RepID=UPI00080546AB|nr:MULTISPECIES: hypothetical protein [unclassified Chryseobacterium]OBW40833.1 hypothetical protein AB670_02784 [Chryseobacterium sp. MOF25P]OBW45297.1 hypothetical protein AB671_02594 [Chryseobacterium sp. BGARF1]